MVPKDGRVNGVSQEICGRGTGVIRKDFETSLHWELENLGLSGNSDWSAIPKHLEEINQHCST